MTSTRFSLEFHHDPWAITPLPPFFCGALFWFYFVDASPDQQSSVGHQVIANLLSALRMQIILYTFRFRSIVHSLHKDMQTDVRVDRLSFTYHIFNLLVHCIYRPKLAFGPLVKVDVVIMMVMSFESSHECFVFFVFLCCFLFLFTYLQFKFFCQTCFLV